MWHKAEGMGYPMRLELIRLGLLIKLANHYTTKGARYEHCMSISHMALIVAVVQKGRLFFLNTVSTSDPVDEVKDGKASYLFGLSRYRLFFLNTDSTSDPVDEHRWESQLSFWVVTIQIVFF